MAVDVEAAEGQAGDAVDLRLVVDDEQLPRLRVRARGRARDVVVEHQQVGLFGGGRGGHGRSWAAVGRRMVTSVPAPGVDATAIAPPSRSVTRLWTMCMPSPLPPRPRSVVKKGS